MSLQKGGQGPSKAAPVPEGWFPQNWYEWWASVYDPDTYILEAQSYSVTVPAVATVPDNSAPLTIPEEFFCFAPRSYGIDVVTGLPWVVPYRIGFKVANANDWFGTQILCPIVTGDNGSYGYTQDKPFKWPKHLAQNLVVTIIIDNSLTGAVSLDVDVELSGYVIRKLLDPIERKKQ